MKALLNKLHARLGDFWWHSLMLFCALRVADVMNMFVGLWLVPKYIGMNELGAVLPLTTFATTLALPAYVFAMTFMKEVNTLAVHQEYGKMKSLMRGVFIGVGVFIVLAIIASVFLLPLFLERIRVVNGMLGVLILVSAFIGCVAPVYTNALQALKRFTALSVINIIGAPLRLLTMLVAMPFRPLSGYFVGQSANPAFSMVASIFCLRKELSVPAEPYWTRPVFKRFMFLFLGMAAYQVPSMVSALVESTVLRQRIPEVESAAYYIMTRFSDITMFVSSTLLMTLFPYTAERAAKGKSTAAFVFKSSAVLIAFSAMLSGVFAIFGKSLIGLLPQGEDYSAYAPYIPWLIATTTLYSIQCFYTNTEASAGRFGFLRWWIPLHVVIPTGLLLYTGYGYLSSVIPPTVIGFVERHRIDSLQTFMLAITGICLVRTGLCLVALWRQKMPTTTIGA